MADDVFQKAQEGLTAHSENERKEAVLTLLKLKDRRAIDLLAKLCEMDRSAEVRTQARKAYYLLRDIHPNKLDEPFLELPDGISFDDLEKLLVDENPRIRREAIKLAGKLDPQSTAPPLRRAIAVEKSPQLQVGILLGLGRAGLKYDIPTIAEFLNKGDANLQIAAIEALAMIGEADALEYVVPLLRDSDSRVRAAATKALPPLEGGEMLNLLRGMAISTNQTYRDAAIFSLQRFKAPLASKIMAHIAAVDPVIPLREKARAGLEAMARSDENARKALELLNTPEEPEDPNAPVTVPLDGIWETTTPEATTAPASPGAPGTPATPGVPGASPAPGAAVAPGAPATSGAPAAPVKPRVLVVPGVTKKLVKAICLGDQAQREDGLRQLAALLTPEHVPFLLLQLDREKDPRIASHLLTLVGKTKAPHAYAAVVKRFKDVDNRVRANAIEAAMQIDPITTPDRIAGFLNDPNNRIRANVILASATRPNFDALVWVRDLAAFGDPAYRRSALFVIARLQNPAFLETLEILIYDDDLEVRHMAHKEIQGYADRGVKKAKELAEVADRLMSKTNLPDQDFHSAMVAMRAPGAVKKPVRKSTKTATEELGEQLLGSDGLKAAGKSIKNLQEQAKVAREKMTARLSQTTASITSGGSWKKMLGLAACIGLVLLGILFLGPWASTRFGPQDADPAGTPRVKPPAETGIRHSANPASRAVSLPPKGTDGRTASPSHGTPLPGDAGKKPPTEKTASAPQQLPAAIAGVRVVSPAKSSMIIGDFAIKAVVTGKPKSVDFMLDDTILKTIEAKKEGAVELTGQNSEKHPAGGHLIRVRVTDIAGGRAETQVFVKFMTRLPIVNIKSPANGAVFWRDNHFLVDVRGSEYDSVEFLLDDALICAYPADPANLYDYPVPIATLTEGPHTFAARVLMTDGRVASDSTSFRALVPKPKVSFLSPKNRDEVFGTVPITLEVDSGWKETAIRKVSWFADGMEKKALASPPWQDSWATADLEPGTHELKAVIENELDRTAEAVIRVNVIQPKFSGVLKGLRSGQVLVEDTRISIEVVNESPGTKIEKVSLFLDDAPFQKLVYSPYEMVIRVNDLMSGTRKMAAEVVRSDGQTFRVSPITFSVNPPNRRSLFFRAQTGAGKPVSATELKAARLEFKEDGQKVSGFTLHDAADIPLHFGLLINVSAALKLDNKIEKVKGAVIGLIDRLKPADQTFLLKFSDTPEIVAEFTSDRTRLQQEIEYLAPQRGTALYDAIFMAVEASAKNTEGTTLILVTNSGDLNLEKTGPASKRTFAEVVEVVRRHHVQIFAVGLGTDLQTSMSTGEDELRSLATGSGGKYFAAPSVSELPAAFEALLADIRGQTRLTFSSPQGPPDGKWHTIEISAPETPDLKILAKPGYQAR